MMNFEDFNNTEKEHPRLSHFRTMNTSKILNRCSLFDIKFHNTEQGTPNDDLRSILHNEY
jgi:hypothetical protein